MTPDHIELGSAYNSDTWTPTHFTSLEGMYIRQWNGGPISDIDLMNKRDKSSVLINGIVVHALVEYNRFGDIIQRWDCISGLTHRDGVELNV